MPPLPTSAKHTAVPYTPIDPHAESHEVNGADPVLGDIRLLSLAISTVAQEIETTSATSHTFYEVTAFTQNIQTRGGILRITFGGSWLMTDDGDTCASIWRVTVGDTISSFYVERFEDSNSTNQFTLRGTPFIWLVEVIPGTYEVKLEAGSITASNAFVSVPSSDTGASAFLQIEELLPIRRG